MNWGTVWQITPMAITGYAMFDWFFTVVMAFGVVGWFLGTLLNLITRS